MSNKFYESATEIKIPVPWGHIAGKVWGKPSDQPVLAIHGKQDNCGVFDRLIPLLNGKFYIVAIDLPGHGFSSHFPSGLPPHFLDYMIAIVNVLEYVKWTRFYYLGHSLGGQIGIFFSALFPQYVERLLVIDHIAPDYVDDKDVLDKVRRGLNSFFKMNARLQSGSAPVYGYQEALNKLTNRESALTTEAAEIVLKRSLQRAENGYMFCMDQRLKLLAFPTLTTHMMLDVLKNIKCPILFVFSSSRVDFYAELYHECMDYIKKKQGVTIKVVSGNHDVHQNHPERVVPLVDDFFLCERSKSWNSSSPQHVLLVHGIQHNCCAFNRLIPLLTGNYNIVAVDLPGHGHSSHFPPGVPFDLYDFVLSVQRVIDFLNWETFICIGHSFGGQIGTYYTSFFAQHIEMLIIIDTMEPRPVPLEDTFSHTKLVLSQYLSMEKKLSSNCAPVYTREEAFSKVKKNHIWELSTEATNDLMERAVVPNGSGVSFTGDQRLKLLLRPILTFSQQREILKNINCPVFFILANGNMERYSTYLKDVYEFNSSRKNTTITVVKGSHAVHQNNPERISFLIDEFIADKKINNNHVIL